MDDPLAAVDAKVSAILMERVVLKELAGKTRILVTHQAHVLPLMDRVVYMDKNEIKFIGTPTELDKIEVALDILIDEERE